MSAHITIRKALPEDMEGIHALVYELAVYEKAPEQVITSPDIYRADSDGEKPWFDCLVATLASGEIVGIALYYRAYSTWRGRMLYLDDLVVRESMRGGGIGLMLVQALCKIGLEEKAEVIKWQVLDWNEPAIRFYRRLNAHISTEWYNCTLDPAKMQAVVDL